MTSLPACIIAVFAPFATIFLNPKTASKALLLLAGAMLCRGGRTVCAALKILGMEGESRFDKYHRVLSRDSWSPLEGGKILLKRLIGSMGSVVIMIRAKEVDVGLWETYKKLVEEERAIVQ